jgi:hypothetical protein
MRKKVDNIGLENFSTIFFRLLSTYLLFLIKKNIINFDKTILIPHKIDNKNAN